MYILESQFLKENKKSKNDWPLDKKGKLEVKPASFALKMIFQKNPYFHMRQKEAYIWCGDCKYSV